jgi:hypothetical protein
MNARSAGARAGTRAAGDDHEQPTRTVARDSTRRERSARRPEWLSPRRAQLMAELSGLVDMLSDEDVDALVDLGIGLWRSSSRRCVDARDARPDA